MKNKKILTAAMIALLVFDISAVQASDEKQKEKDEITILYTNDVHNSYQRDDEKHKPGYAALASYRDELEEQGKNVLLLDGGDSIQGGIPGGLSNGKYIIELMNAVGYDAAVPGNHEFDYGMENFLTLVEKEALFPYVSCNLIDLTTNETVLKPYTILECGNATVACIGISTPLTMVSSTPVYFQNDDGEFIYSFSGDEDGQLLYDTVQKSIDSACAEGADYVVALAHTGTGDASEPYGADEIVAHTHGLTAYLDAHSHIADEESMLKDKDGCEVLHCNTGSNMAQFAQVTLTSDGTASSKFVTDVDTDDEQVLEKEQEINKACSELTDNVVAQSDVRLAMTDPQNGERLVRKAETNLGDLVADAYRSVTGAQISLVNGGGLRADIEAGDITLGDLIKALPYGNEICEAELTGQQIMDILEAGAANVENDENDSFQHVSGMTYCINTQIPSSVVRNATGNVTEITGAYRVCDVLVGNEPLEVDKIYTVAGPDYLLKKNGSGLLDPKKVTILKDEVCLDYEALIKYITKNLGGKINTDSGYENPSGQGRIQILTKE